MNKIIMFICSLVLALILFLCCYSKVVAVVFLCIISVLVVIIILYVGGATTNESISKHKLLISFVISLILYSVNNI
jgi:hypothetical protein